MFGALKPGIEFEAVERNGQTVLIDFRGETDPQLKLFKLLWIFSTIFEYIKLRGRREHPLGLIIDEMASLCQHVTAGENPLADLLDEFINVYMRNHHIYFTCAHQSIYQLDDKLRNSLLSLGTYIFGRPATIQEARELGDLLWKNDPFRVKHSRKVWGKVDPPLLLGYSRYGYDRYPARYQDYLKWQSPDFPDYLLATEPEFMSLEDQREEAANILVELGLFEFILRPSLREGEVSSTVSQVNLAGIVTDKATGELCFPNQAVVAQVRSLLEATAGTPIKTLLAEQDALLARGHLPPQPDHGKTRHAHPEAVSKERSASAVASAEIPQASPELPRHAVHHRRRRIS
jgi:hypothetical protein